MMCVPTPAADGVNTPVEETPGPDRVPPEFTAVSCVAGALEQKGPVGFTVPSGGPVCAAGEGAKSNVKLVEVPDQFSTTMKRTSPAVTIGDGTLDAHGNAVPI